MFGLLGIITALSPVIIIVSIYFSSIFGASPGWERDSSWLFLLVASSFLITVLGGCFSVSCLIHSRFLSINIVNLMGILTRVGLILALYSALPGRLWYVGGASLTAAVVVLAGFVYLWRRLTPELHISLAAFDRVRLGAMASMSSWMMVNMVGAALLGRVDLLVINAFYGSAVTGGYASVAQFAMFMEYLVTAASGVVRPIILIKYAQGDQAGLQKLAAQSVKLLGLGLGLPVGLLCGLAPSLLTVWLGPSYAYLAGLLIIVIFHLSLNLSIRPLLHIQNAYNKVRWPGLATLLSGIANLGLAIFLARWGIWGAAGVAVATAIAWTAKNGVYMPIYTARAMDLRWWTFMPHLIASIAGTALAWGLAYGVTLVRMPDSWLTLGASAAAVSLVYTLIIWAWGLNGDDRALLKALMPFQITVHSPSLSTTSRKGG
jgi:membrane protein EpsK